MVEMNYVCETCLKERTAAEGDAIPVCCGRPMAPELEGCRKPFVAETARPDDRDEPCDDGTDPDRKNSIN